jgi:hypothetical protein
MKILTKTAMVLAIIMAATMAQADDAAMKKEMLGYWTSGRHSYLFKDDGIAYMMGGTTKNKWDIRNGTYYSDGFEYKIISLTKNKLTYQDSSGTHALKRITKAEAELNGKPGELP